jgi:hypothetical protein
MAYSGRLRRLAAARASPAARPSADVDDNSVRLPATKPDSQESLTFKNQRKSCFLGSSRYTDDCVEDTRQLEITAWFKQGLLLQLQCMHPHLLQLQTTAYFGESEAQCKNVSIKHNFTYVYLVRCARGGEVTAGVPQAGTPAAARGCLCNESS